MNKKVYDPALINEIKAQYPEAQVEIYSERRLYVKVSPDRAYDLAKFLFAEKRLRFSIATGIDTRDGIEILYHFSHDPTGTFWTIKTVLSKDNLKIKSLTDFLPAANWIEREIHELLGVEFTGHPNLAPLLTSDDWPRGVYPLRRDYE
ncbi:MAG: NADH-quinone oxidoreductase subunit C [candidate division WOR-3 bacterium]